MYNAPRNNPFALNKTLKQDCQDPLDVKLPCMTKDNTPNLRVI